jgi:hypothetical protein
MSGQAAAWATPTDYRITNGILQYYAQIIVDETAPIRCRRCHELKSPAEFRKRLVKRGSRGFGRLTSDCLGCRGLS